jgi:hypothetical protein
MSEPRVFVVQEPLVFRHGKLKPKIDLSPANEFGKIVFLLDWSDTKDLIDTDKIIWMLRDRFAEHEFGPEDYVLLIGDWTAMALAVTIALEETDGQIRCLQWDRKDGEYKVINIDLDAPPPDVDPFHNLELEGK